MSERDSSGRDNAHKGAGRVRRPPAPCPICGKMAVAAYHPFCSRRCADIDLGRWLGGRYAIAGHADEQEESPIDRTPSDDGPSDGEDDGGAASA